MTSKVFLDAPCTVVLGGGGVRGIAHVGVLRALAECGVQVREIVGTSIGAIVGAAVAAGVDWETLSARAARFTRDDIVMVNRWALLLNGIRQTSVFTGERLRAFIEEVVPPRDWSELKISLCVNAVDVQSARVEWFGAGGRQDVALHDAIYASSALPLYYPPAELAGRYYFDGGILDPLLLQRADHLRHRDDRQRHQNDRGHYDLDEGEARFHESGCARDSHQQVPSVLMT